MSRSGAIDPLPVCFSGEGALSRIPVRRTLGHRSVDQQVCSPRTGSPAITAHRFRHTVGTQLANRGAKLHTVMKVLGHQSANMAVIYAQISDRRCSKTTRPSLDQGRSLQALRLTHFARGSCRRKRWIGSRPISSKRSWNWAAASGYHRRDRASATSISPARNSSPLLHTPRDCAGDGGSSKNSLQMRSRVDGNVRSSGISVPSGALSNCSRALVSRSMGRRRSTSSGRCTRGRGRNLPAGAAEAVPVAFLLDREAPPPSACQPSAAARDRVPPVRVTHSRPCRVKAGQVVRWGGVGPLALALTGMVDLVDPHRKGISKAST